MKNLILLVVLFVCSMPDALGVEISIFWGKRVFIPEDCYFKVHLNNKSFECPIKKHVSNSVFFRSPEEVKNAYREMSKNSNSSDLEIAVPLSEKIDDFEHFMFAVQTGNIVLYQYEICDESSCIGVASRDLSFISSIVSQINDRALYD